MDPLIRVHSYHKIRVLLAVWCLVDPPLYVEQARAVRALMAFPTVLVEVLHHEPVTIICPDLTRIGTR